MVPRTDALLELFGIDPDLDPVQKLRETQDAAQSVLETPEFSVIETEPGTSPPWTRHVLTAAGESIALDLGLLLGRLLIEAFPDKLRWEIGGKPKSDVNYNWPTLVGYAVDGFSAPINPLMAGIGRCTSALTMPKMRDGLAQSFERVAKSFGRG